jgi:hypothetical protein
MKQLIFGLVASLATASALAQPADANTVSTATPAIAAVAASAPAQDSQDNTPAPQPAPAAAKPAKQVKDGVLVAGGIALFAIALGSGGGSSDHPSSP